MNLINEKYPLDSLKNVKRFVCVNMDKSEILTKDQYNMVERIISLINENNQDFHKLFNGITKHNSTRYPIVIVDLIKSFCGKMTNIDNLLKKLSIEILCCISKRKICDQTQGNKLAGTLFMMLKTIDSLCIKFHIIIVISNMVKSTRYVDEYIDILQEFMSQFMQLTSNEQQFVKEFDNQCTKEIVYKICDENIKLIMNLKIIDNFNNLKSTTKRTFVQFLSMIKDFISEKYELYLIYMVYEITFSNRSNNTNLCDDDLIDKTMSILKLQLMQPTRKCLRLEYYAISTVSFVIGSYPNKINHAQLYKLISSGLMKILEKIITSKDKLYKLDNITRLIKLIAINILNFMIKELFLSDYLLYTDSMERIFESFMKTSVNDPHYNELIEVICNTIIFSTHNLNAHRYLDICSFKDKCMNKVTNENNRKLIRIAFRKKK